MKANIAWTLMAVLIESAVRAQTNAPSPDLKPASSDAPGVEFPKIDTEGRAYFRMVASNASNISLSLPGGAAMTKSADGVWMGVTSPLAPGFHYYTMDVDGAVVPDPASIAYFGTSKVSSGIEVPSAGEDFYSPKEVPHGDVRAHFYFSKSTGLTRRCFVYTPPDYDTNLAARYPVLYLQHGMGEDARGWPTQGRARLILDNLIAGGKARPMIVVMEDGGITPGAMGPPKGPPGSRFWDKFGPILINDIIPMIDETYRTIPDRNHRAMAGLSLGGTQTWEITQAHPETFSSIGSFSAPFGFPEVPGGFNGLLGDPAAFARQFNVLFVSMGSEEKERTGGSRAFHEALEKAGIKHVYYESAGTAHEWQTWRRSLHEFAPLLFQKSPGSNP